MALNPSISLGVRPLEVPNQLAQYAQVQQLMGAQRQAEVADMQMEALRRDRETLDKIQAAIVAKGGPPDLAAAADEMIRSGKPEFLTQGMAIRQKLADQLAFTNYQKEFAPGAAPTGMPAPAAGSFAADTAARRAALPVNAFAAPVEAPVNALAPAAAPAPVAPVNAMVGQPDIAALEARYRRVANLDTPGAKAEAALLLKQIDRAATATPADIKTMQALGYPITQAGYQAFRDAQRQDRLLTSEEEEQRIRMAKAGRAPAQPAQPSAPVAVVGDDGKIKYVSREDAINKGMTPASAIESLSPKEIQKREAALPQAKQAVKTVSNTMSVIGQTVDSLLANPEGIDGITGLIYGVTPAITGPARKAKAELEQLKNLAFIQGITELRAASKTGAAVGNVTNREGDRFENLKASLDRSQSKEDLIAALKKLKTQADLTTQFMTEAFDDTYSYKSAAPAGGRASGVDANNPLLKK
jgi:hypothetical protein